MDFFARLTSAIFNRILSQFQCERKESVTTDYSRPAIQSHKGRRSSSSSANLRISLSSSIVCRRRAFASSILPATLAYLPNTNSAADAFHRNLESRDIASPSGTVLIPS